MNPNKNIFKSLKNWLNEKSINDIDITDVINSKTVNHIIQDNYNTEYFMYRYADENSLDVLELGDSDEWANTKEGQQFIKYDIEYIAEEIINNFKYNIIGNNIEIPIWRAITVDDNWLDHIQKQGQRLGQYWSYTPSGAVTHWGDYAKYNVAVIESSIAEEYIDWIDTIRLNMMPLSEEEKEVRLFKNTPIKINKIWINKKEIEISDFIKNKIFKA
jgi:hypothetical protein